MRDDLVRCRALIFVYQEQRYDVAKVIGYLIRKFVKVWPGVLSGFELSINVFTLGGMERCSANSESVPTQSVQASGVFHERGSHHNTNSPQINLFVVTFPSFLENFWRKIVGCSTHSRPPDRSIIGL